MNFVDDTYFADFGVFATIGAASVQGILDQPPSEVFGVLGSSPTFTCATADVSGIAAGQEVTIESVAYTVTAVRADGAGVTVLVLDTAA